MYKSITYVRKQSGKLYQSIYFKENVLLKKMLYISTAKKSLYVLAKKSPYTCIPIEKSICTAKKNIPMQIIHITQLIKKPLNKLERFFKKACDYRFFVCISRITSIFVARLFFRKRFSHVSIVIHVEICKKISVAITNGFFVL